MTLLPWCSSVAMVFIDMVKERNFISNCPFVPILLYVLCQCIYVLKFEIKYVQTKRLIKAILMSAHNILCSIYKKKITLNYPKPAAVGLLQRTQKRV